MNLLRKTAEALYNQVINYYRSLKQVIPYAPPVSVRIKQKLIRLLLRFSDPVIEVVFGTRSKIVSRLSYENVLYYARCPLYDRALPRICSQIQDIDGDLRVIDIGANIGDTAILISETTKGASLLCIEGNKAVMDVLEQNIARINHNQIYIEPKFCLESSNDTQYAVAMERGTAQLVKSGNTGINGDTLDSILMRHETFQKANLLKIDTDGFEIKVLKGAGKLLENGPVIYFEFNPDVYAANGESTFELLDMLVSHGYTKALFYTNFGVPAGICNFSDKHKIQELIDNIDNKTIYYYDILTITDNTYSRYESILKNEMKILEK